MSKLRMAAVGLPNLLKMS